ncbi:hypothetical protein TBLA_0D05420 [Henningerozyma blattae CBS 6284]|uniref:Zn(2)-C6 fungal-type domain-containing protein n=1 Tax=Henningerozyma blattae (strain ATCC 34711 / CBS 6284 / DSM 70876 / NBRC 10599 / NRRL Y-10934 / UCD 77-7) TaxID=1071380 RepID=I2H3T3_HENB6|nr:hypothetical protein TBLA_0D05420 [Tetrapisispora blattae CBS 6284]CCH61035.1 hypothetical protein TBLA_0D05420 [Tetrapisispora blattae CBS 6284]
MQAQKKRKYGRPEHHVPYHVLQAHPHTRTRDETIPRDLSVPRDMRSDTNSAGSDTNIGVSVTNSVGDSDVANLSATNNSGNTNTTNPLATIPTGRRHSQACDRCRLKKIKCDGLIPHCTNCRKINFNCQTTHKLSRRGLPKGYTEMLEQKLTSLQNSLANQKPLPPRQLQPGFQELLQNPLPPQTDEHWTNELNLQLLSNHLTLNKFYSYYPQFLLSNIFKNNYKTLNAHVDSAIDRFFTLHNSLVEILPLSLKPMLKTDSYIANSSLLLLIKLYVIQFNWSCLDEYKLFKLSQIIIAISPPSDLIQNAYAIAIWYFMSINNKQFTTTLFNNLTKRSPSLLFLESLFITFSNHQLPRNVEEDPTIVNIITTQSTTLPSSQSDSDTPILSTFKKLIHLLSMSTIQNTSAEKAILSSTILNDFYTFITVSPSPPSYPPYISVLHLFPLPIIKIHSICLINISNYIIDNNNLDNFTLHSIKDNLFNWLKFIYIPIFNSVDLQANIPLLIEKLSNFFNLQQNTTNTSTTATTPGVSDYFENITNFNKINIKVLSGINLLKKNSNVNINTDLDQFNIYSNTCDHMENNPVNRIDSSLFQFFLNAQSSNDLTSALLQQQNDSTNNIIQQNASPTTAQQTSNMDSIFKELGVTNVDTDDGYAEDDDDDDDDDESETYPEDGMEPIPGLKNNNKNTPLEISFNHRKQSLFQNKKNQQQLQQLQQLQQQQQQLPQSPNMKHYINNILNQQHIPLSNRDYPKGKDES